MTCDFAGVFAEIIFGAWALGQPRRVARAFSPPDDHVKGPRRRVWPRRNDGKRTKDDGRSGVVRFGQDGIRIGVGIPRTGRDGLLVSGPADEVVGDTQGDELWGQASVGEAEPALHLVFGAKPDMRPNLEVRANPADKQVVGEIGLAIGIFEVAAPDHRFDVGNHRAVGKQVASSDLVGPLRGQVSIGATDLVELGFDAEVRPKVEVGIGGKPLEGLLAVVRAGVGVADADLKVPGARGRGDGLSVKDGRPTEQQR